MMCWQLWGSQVERADESLLGSFLPSFLFPSLFLLFPPPFFRPRAPAGRKGRRREKGGQWRGDERERERGKGEVPEGEG